MKVVVLGSGTCASQLPGVPNRYPPGFLVTWGKNEENKVLFECSEGIRFRLEKAGYDYCDIRYIAISHAHPDHFALVHYLQSMFGRGLYLGKNYPQVYVYCPSQIVEDFPLLFRAHNPEWGDVQEYWFPKIALFPMSRSKLEGHDTRCIFHDFVFGQCTRLTARRAYHGFGKVDALAFRLSIPEGIFAFSGDTGVCENLHEIAKEADIFVCEASARIGDEKTPYPDRGGYGHLTPYVAGDIARQSGVKKLVLFHYTGLDSDEAMIEDCRKSGYQGEIIIAKDFQVFEV